jgi:hypothetical protein
LTGSPEIVCQQPADVLEGRRGCALVKDRENSDIKPLGAAVCLTAPPRLRVPGPGSECQADENGSKTPTVSNKIAC